MAMKLEQKKVTYNHSMDSQDKTSLDIDRNKSMEPNSGLRETIDGLGKNRLRLQYNVGKNPQTKSIQSVK